MRENDLDYLSPMVLRMEQESFVSHTGCCCGAHTKGFKESDDPPPCLPKLGVLDSHSIGPHSSINNRERFNSLYSWGEKLHEGTKGLVFAGTRLSDNLPVAIKIVLKRTIPEMGRLGWQSMPLEALSLLMVRGVQGITNLIDLFDCSHQYWLVLERPNHCVDLLSHVTKNGPISEDKARHYFRQVVDTARALLQRGFVHRDIKDDNVLICTETERAFLTDFGAAACKQRVPYCEYDGYELYSPPEWDKLRRYFGEAATVWTLGVLLHVMLCATPPFDSVKRKMQGFMRGEIGVGSNLSEGAEHVILRCLSIDHENRPTLEQLVQHPWLSYDPSSAGEPPTFDTLGELEEVMRCPDGSVFVFSIPNMMQDCSLHNSNECDKDDCHDWGGHTCQDERSRRHKDSLTSTCSEDCPQVPEIVIEHS